MNKIPCKECLVYPTCTGLSWSQLIDKCSLLYDYLIKINSDEENAHMVRGRSYINIKSLEQVQKVFSNGKKWY